MVATVLGKRARCLLETEDIASNTQRATKRVTRQSAPVIFEDVQAYTPQKQHKTANHTSRSSASKSARDGLNKRAAKCTGTSYNTTSTIAESVENVNDENCDPLRSEDVTPTAARFKNVNSSPCTPRHKIKSIVGTLTPRTPRSQDGTTTRISTVYGRARQLFAQSAVPVKLVGREDERNRLRRFLSRAIDTRTGGCMYASGPPGTGKSALVQEILQEYESKEGVRVARINCVALRSTTQLYEKLFNDLAPESKQSRRTVHAQLQGVLTKRDPKTTYIVLLDEVDSLVNEECEILYSIFEWSMHTSSSLALIGVANALDLTDRFLPRLRAKSLSPTLLPFLPYTAQQISAIITHRLRTLLLDDATVAADFVPCMHPAAVQLCGKKIAGQTGDVRKAFALVKKAIDQIESETMAKQGSIPLGELENSTARMASPVTKCSLVNLSTENAPRATITHVVKAAASVFNRGTNSRLGGLNLQQKVVLCSLVSKEAKRQKRDPYTTPTKSAYRAPSVRELYFSYRELCKRDDGLLQALHESEFRDVVASLETLGLVHESRSRSSSLLTPTSSSTRAAGWSDDRQVVSAVTDQEMRTSLGGPGADLLRRLLDQA